MRNACAQRALAEALGLDARDVNAQHPPDTPFALLGTTPWRVLRAARALGASTRVVRSDDALVAALREGPALVLLDNARLGGRIGYHWAVARASGPDGVEMTALAAGPAARIVPWPEFRAAWRSWAPGPYRGMAIALR